MSTAEPTESESKVLREVLRGDDVTQPNIIRATGLSQQTVSRLVAELIDRGALRQGNRVASGKRGQPSFTVVIDPEYACSLGVSLMTDAMAVILMDFSGGVRAHRHIPLAAMSRAAVFDNLDRTVDEVFSETGLDRDRLTGVGVGISGYNLDGKTRFNPPRQLDDWAMVELDHLFSNAMGVPAWAENDGNAAAIGESLLGAGKKLDNFVYLFIAAGIGGGVILNHQLWRGVHGNGGEIGLILPREVFQMPTLTTLYQAIARAGVALDGMSDMLDRFDADWPGVEEWIERSRDPLSQIASSIAALLDPDAIVIGGRIPRSLAERIIPTIELYDDARRTEPRALPRIIVSETEYDSCAIGAAMLPLEQRFFSTML